MQSRSRFSTETVPRAALSLTREAFDSPYLKAMECTGTRRSAILDQYVRISRAGRAGGTGLSGRPLGGLVQMCVNHFCDYDARSAWGT